MKLYRYRKLLALAAAGAVATAGIGAIMNPKPQPVQEVVYTVQEGDTLWRIADQHKTSGENIQELIYEIKQDNPQIKEYIYPGQQLKISIKKELADISVSANSHKN